MNMLVTFRKILIPKILQPIAIAGGFTISFLNSNLLFGVIVTVFTISYVISLIPTQPKKEPEPVDNKNVGSLESYLATLESRIDSSLENKLQIIPVLNEQLQSVIKQTDEAAGGLTEAFMGISRQAKKQLNEVQELFGNISENTGGNILSQTQENLQQIQSNFSTLTSYFDKSIEMISEVLEQLNKIDAFAENIVKIGKTTNILALNASIEAASSGETGRGFKVLAAEINVLSKKSNTSINEITEINENLTTKVNEIKHELVSVQEHSKTIEASTNELFSMTIGKIGNTLQNTAEKIQTIAKDAEGLSKKISQVVVSIQFQDITRQQIEHVIAPLELLKNELTNTIDGLLKIDPKSTSAEELSTTDSLMKQYTMESERDILKKFTDQNKI